MKHGKNGHLDMRIGRTALAFAALSFAAVITVGVARPAQACQASTQACSVFDPCCTGLVCVAGECRHDPGLPGEICGALDPCAAPNVCQNGRCTACRTATASCEGLGQGTCCTDLECVSGECRHDPGLPGEICGALDPCAAPNVCQNARCTACRTATSSCEGLGQGTCCTDLECVAGECRHEPGLPGEICGALDPCAAPSTCQNGRCAACRDAKTSCEGSGQGTCCTGLECVTGECRHEPGLAGEVCGALDPCAAPNTCQGGRCAACRVAQTSCEGLGQGTCCSDLECITGECRHEPGLPGEVCGALDPCTTPYTCRDGRCVACRESLEGCGVLGGGGDCCEGLVCDAAGECRHDPPETCEACGVGVPCAGAETCSDGRCSACKRSRASCGVSGGGGDCCAGLECVDGECRNDPGLPGEICGLLDPCVASATCTDGRCLECDGACSTAGIATGSDCGDPTGDGQVNASDALFVLRVAVQLLTCPLSVCDIDNSGAINATDALITLRYAVGLNVPLSCPTTQPATGYDIQVEFLTTMTATQRQAFTLAAKRWSEVISGDLPDVDTGALNGGAGLDANLCGVGDPARSDVIDDLLIYASIGPIDGASNILAQASPCVYRTGNPGLSFLGKMKFDVADVVDLEDKGKLTDVILHEMGHVLGVGSDWSMRGLLANPSVDSSGMELPLPNVDTYFSGASARAGFDMVGGTAYVGGQKVPAENDKVRYNVGSLDTHWREAELDNELMSPSLDSGVDNPLSVVTIGSLEDLGYEVAPAAADGFCISQLVPRRRSLTKSIEFVDCSSSGPVYKLNDDGRPVRIR